MYGPMSFVRKGGWSDKYAQAAQCGVIDDQEQRRWAMVKLRCAFVRYYTQYTMFKRFPLLALL